MSSEKILITAKEAQWLLGIGRNKMISLLNSKSFPAMKIGNKWYVNKEKLKLWADKESEK